MLPTPCRTSRITVPLPLPMPLLPPLPLVLLPLLRLLLLLLRLLPLLPLLLLLLLLLLDGRSSSGNPGCGAMALVMSGVWRRAAPPPAYMPPPVCRITLSMACTMCVACTGSSSPARQAH